MIRDYGWRGGGAAAGVTEAGVGSGECIASIIGAMNGNIGTNP
jgi:hypothetical protein